MMEENGHKELVELAEDSNGFPVLLAVRAPGQVAAQPSSSGARVFRGARSGNPQFDPVTGRFAGSGSKPTTPDVEIVANANSLPQGVTQEQWERRQDIVRELARQASKELNNDYLQGFLAKHPQVQDAAAVDIESLKRDIRAQQLEDLVDILDAQLKSRVDLKNNVRLQAPRRWVPDVIARLQDNEVLDVAKRLEGGGYGEEVIKKQFVAKIKDKERRDKLDQLYGEDRKRRS
jgi:hypothetical protein